MLGHCGAGDAAVAVEDVYNSWREAGFFDQVGEDEDAEWCLLSRFENDGVAAGERWAEFPGSHRKGIVPRYRGQHVDGDMMAMGLDLRMICAHTPMGSRMVYASFAVVVSMTWPWILSAQPA